MDPRISFSFLFEAVFQGSVHSNIQGAKGVNNIETVIFLEIIHEIYKLIFQKIRSGSV